MKNQKIVIEFLALLGGYSQPFMLKYRGKMALNILEAPFLIHREDGSRLEGCCIEINLDELVGKPIILNNIDNDKAANWLLQELESVPKDMRNKRWVRKISFDTLKLWQKET